MGREGTTGSMGARAREARDTHTHSKADGERARERDLSKNGDGGTTEKKDKTERVGDLSNLLFLCACVRACVCERRDRDV